MTKRLTKEQQLNQLRKCFRYYADGTADIYSYGAFKRGVTGDEIDDYLRVRAGKMNIKVIRNKFNKIAGCNTATCATVTGEVMTVGGPEKTTIHVTLNYRHDVERFADVLFKNKPTYFD